MPQWKVNKYWIYSYLVLYAFPHTTCKSTCITIVFTHRNVYYNERSPPVKQYTSKRNLKYTCIPCVSAHMHWCLYHSERKPPVKYIIWDMHNKLHMYVPHVCDKTAVYTHRIVFYDERKSPANTTIQNKIWNATCTNPMRACPRYAICNCRLVWCD